MKTGTMRRLRTAVKWLATAAALLLAGAFLFSLVRAADWTSPTTRYQIGLQTGGFLVGWRPAGWDRAEEKYPAKPGWSVAKYSNWISWPRGWMFRGSLENWKWINLPLGLLFLPAAMVAAVLWYVDRRRTTSMQRAFTAKFVPKRAVRLTVRRVLLGCFLNGFATLCLGVFVTWMLRFLRPPPESAVQFALEVIPDLLVWLVFLPSPILGYVWARAFTKWQNTRRDRLYGLLCSVCTYDLRGNVSGVCPECGTPTEKSIEHAD